MSNEQNQPKENKNMRLPDTIPLWFDVELTDDELLDAGQEMTQIIDKITDLDNERKRIASEFKGKIEEQRGDLFDVSRKVKNKSEQREVVVYTEYNLDEKKAIYISVDTGEEMGSRPMRPNEIAAAKQYTLDLEWNEGIQTILNTPVDDDGEEGAEDAGSDLPTMGPDDGLDDDPIEDPEDPRETQ